MTIRITEGALADLDEGWVFYERQDRGLGDYFVASLKSDIEALRITAGIHPKPHRNLHRALSKRFPFAIFYLFNDEVAEIYAIVDCRRDPAWIRGRLR